MMKNEIKDSASKAVTLALSTLLVELVRKGIGALMGKPKDKNV